MKHVGLIYLLPFFCLGQPIPTAPTEVVKALEQKKEMARTSLLKNMPFKNIGPSAMGGRVVDLDVNPKDPTEFYVAYASGGLWHTNDNGISFKPIMDSSATQNIGDIAVDWKNSTLWVGTGENNASRSSYAGIGILKSEDNGATWKNMGLLDSHHTGRILINPRNSDDVVVSVMGHLYSPNSERGVYKTIDGGKTWNKTLFIDDTTGIIDLAHSPKNFNIMYAAAWKRDRKAWNFTGSGRSSGIYKSTDGGVSWELISTGKSGFPTGEGVGRIGLAVFDDDIVYAVLDNQSRKPKKTKARPSRMLSKEAFKIMDEAAFLKLGNKRLTLFLKENGFPEEYTAKNVKQLIKEGAITPMDLAKYLENANSLLFDTPVIGAEVYRSENGGSSWQKRNEEYIDDLFYSYGYYFGQIWVDPNIKDKIYIAGVPLLTSNDGGQTFASIGKDNVHVDHHALWINPNKSDHLINGNDGGVNMTYNGGDTWVKNNSPKVGQFYAINVDDEKPYNVYGGLQDNGVWKARHDNSVDKSWYGSGEQAWKFLIGGDGMQVQIDQRNANIIYTGAQFGEYNRLDLKKNKTTKITPKHLLGEAPYRFNWQTPILLSPHNQDILYLGSHKIHRSINQGTDWESISKDLTKGGKKGNVSYGTITTISESPLQQGLIYVGTDDGLVQVTRNGGANWQMVSNNLPKDLWVSEVVASKHKLGRVYVCLNGYRWDDFTAYIYVSDDFGKTWSDIAIGIPDSPINALAEDPENENLIFVGADNGLYATLDRGKSWDSMQNGMPNVAVHDLVIQPSANHLLVGTHGRSIYKADIRALQELTQNKMEQELVVFGVENIRYSKDWGNPSSIWKRANTPGLDVAFFSKTEGSIDVVVKTADGIAVSRANFKVDKGLNLLRYDLAFDKQGKNNFLSLVKMYLPVAANRKTYLPKGAYSIEITKNKMSQKIDFEIK